VVLHPPARYFGRDKFKFASTSNGIPSDDDLRGILHRGIPGSAMPNFQHLGADEVTAVIGHVRSLIPQGLYERQREAEIARAIKNDDDPVFKPAAYAKNAAEMSQVGEALALPTPIPPSTPEAIARGKVHFLSEAWGCAKCHGPEGKGDGPQTKDPNFKNDDKTPAVPRDLTRGTFKGGSDPAHIFARIRRGIPGTPMPDALAKPEAEAWDVVHYVRSLAPSLVIEAPPFTSLKITGNKP
jgi:mono/diheme cytochrome c family protein